MKKICVKAIAFFLAAITVMFSCALPITVSAAEVKYENDMPIVYVKGSGRTVYNKKGEVIYPVHANLEDKIMEESDALLSGLAVGVASGNWDKYCNTLIKVIKSIYSKSNLDKNGEASDGSYAEPNPEPKKKTENYFLSTYVFNYDSRLDPCAVADDLRVYIKKVLKATGKKKVQLVSRCLGCNIAAAYFDEYGNDLVQSTIFYVPATKGVISASEGFSGELKFDPDLIDSYVDSDVGVGAEISGVLKTVVSVTNKLSVLGMGTELIQSVYDQIKGKIVPELILATYGTMPAYWSCVDDEHFEKAKDLIFTGREEEYAGLIKKIDYYHNNVYMDFEETLEELNKKGMKVCIIAKYNVQLPPFFESSDLLGEGDITVPKVSFGATAGKIGETFSKQYLLEAKMSGVEKYISKDLMVDASTCLFPDYTFFVKNMDHEDFATCVNKIMYEFLRKKAQLTVWNSETFTQFMEYDKANNSLSPVVAADNSGNVGDANNSGGSTNLITILIGLIKKIVEIIQSIF